MRGSGTYITAVLWGALLLSPAAGQVKITEVMDLRAAYPLGGQRGRSVPVSLIGKHLDAPSAVRVEGRGITVRGVTGVSSTEVRAELDIAPEAPLGPCSLRVVGKYGITDPVPFVIGRLPETLELDHNDSAGVAQALTPPIVVNGRFNPQEDLDFFRVSARAGERLLLAVESYVLDATHAVGEGRGRRTVDPTLRVYDAGGSLVAENEDFHTPDPLLVFEPPKTGDYVIELRDLGYQGSAAASYRLTVGDVPWATSLYPAGGRRGQAVEVELHGANLPGPVSSRLDLTAQGPGELSVAPLPELANTRPFLVGELPEQCEVEPNDRTEEANPAIVGSVFNGRLQRPGDVDSFCLSLSRGEKLKVEVLADRVLRSPVDLTLSARDAQGVEIARNDDAGLAHGLDSRDPILQFTAPEAGVYTFVIREVAGRGGPDCVYRATVTRLDKGFHLTTWWDNVLIKGPGGTGAFLALVRREGGFTGPVRVRVKGLPPGYRADEAIITAPLDSALVTITAPEDAQPGTVLPFWLEGEVEIEGRQVVQRAQPRAQRDQDGETIWRPSGGCLAAVGPVTEFQLRTASRVVTGTPGETVHLPIRVRRVPGYEDPFTLNAVQCVFSLGGSPAQFRATVPVPKGAAEVDFALPLPATLPPGEYTFAICRGMGHDFRIDRPYPSTPIIRLVVKSPGR